MSGAALELVRILFGGSDLLLLDEPTNHLDADARTWLLKFLRSYRGALLVVSHDLDLLDEAITRVVHIDREAEERHRHARRVQGHLLAVPRRARPRRGAPGATRRSGRPREIARLSHAGRRRCAGRRPSGPASPRTSTAGSRTARSRPASPVPRRKRRALALRFPTPPHGGRTVLTATELWKSFGALDVFADVVLRRRARRAPPRDGPQRRRQDHAAQGAGRRARRRHRRGRAGHARVGSATTRRSTRASSPGGPCSSTCARRRPPATASCAQPARHVRAQRRQGVPGRGHALRRREDEARARAARRRAPQRAAPRRADQQPRSAVAHRDRARRSRRGRAR